MSNSAQNALSLFLAEYAKLGDGEKFALGNVFHEATGGKMSPYNSPDVVVVAQVMVTDENGETKVLGVRRAIEPFIGGLALPGGFLEPNEDPADGVIREVYEETGIELESQYVKVCTLPKMGHKNHTLVFIAFEKVVSYSDFLNAQEFVKNEKESAIEQGKRYETEELVLLGRHSELCFPLHQEALTSLFEEIELFNGTP